MRAGGTQQKPAMMTRVHAAPLTFVEDGSVGAWIAPRLGPLGGWVGSVIPRGFPAYARVLHPVPDSAVGPAWADVCEVTGSRPHATMQWESIVCRPGEYRRPEMADGNPWPGGDPSIGHLEPEPLVALCDVLADHVHHGSDVFFALWDGYGWIQGGSAVSMLSLSSGDDSGRIEHTANPVPPAFDAEVMDGPRLRLPARDYLVFRGPMHAALSIGHSPIEDWFIPQSPNLIWPADHSWCVATEIDWYSTLVAGNSATIEAVLTHPELEAWRIDPNTGS